MTAGALQVALEGAGFAVQPGLLGGEEVAMLRDCMNALESDRAPITTQVLYTHAAPAEPRPPFERLLLQWLDPHRRHGGGTAAVLALVAQRLRALGCEVAPFQDALVSKAADHAPLPWHQDEPFWPFEAPAGLVAWIALDPVDRGNGGLELARESHRLGRGPAIDLHTGEPQAGAPGTLPDRAALAGECPTLAPGDAVLLHPRTWHRSGRNTDGRPRRAWITSWVPPGSPLRPELAPRHPLARQEVTP